MSTHNIPLLLVGKYFPKLSPFASWPGTMINPQWLKLPISRTNFHAPKIFEPLRFDCRYNQLPGAMNHYKYKPVQPSSLLSDEYLKFFCFFLSFWEMKHYGQPHLSEVWYIAHTFARQSGPSCSKLMMSLVNNSLKFTSSDTQICWNFLPKKCE